MPMDSRLREEVPKRMKVIYSEKLRAGMCNLIYDHSAGQKDRVGLKPNSGKEGNLC